MDESNQQEVKALIVSVSFLSSLVVSTECQALRLHFVLRRCISTSSTSGSGGCSRSGSSGEGRGKVEKSEGRKEEGEGEGENKSNKRAA